jgi:RNA polymerase sigma factor (sigma-70 family)
MIVHHYPTRDELIHRYLGLVNRVVDKYWHMPSLRALGRDEAMSIGYEALVRAAEDYTYQGTFSHFGFLYIRNAMLKAARVRREQHLEHPDRLRCSRRRVARYDIDWVPELLAKLPRESCQILMRRFGVAGKAPETVSQIAEAEGVNPKTVRNRLRRALLLAQTEANRLGLSQPQ